MTDAIRGQVACNLNRGRCDRRRCGRHFADHRSHRQGALDAKVETECLPLVIALSAQREVDAAIGSNCLRCRA